MRDSDLNNSQIGRNPELKDARQACRIEGGPHFMNLAVHDMEDRNAWHAHPLACGRPSAQLSGLRTGKRPTSRNTIILCNKVCDGEINIRECCVDCCKEALHRISAAQIPKRVMELDVGALFSTIAIIFLRAETDA